SRRRHTRFSRDWSSDVCSSDLHEMVDLDANIARLDPLRVIEAVTAGVAFLAAGAIIRSGGNIRGLTTGAGMWMAGAVGVASGSRSEERRVGKEWRCRGAGLRGT